MLYYSGHGAKAQVGGKRGTKEPSGHCRTSVRQTTVALVFAAALFVLATTFALPEPV